MGAGRKFKFKDAAELNKACMDYFIWCEQNPIRGQRFIKKDNGETETRDEMYPRPFTFEGMCEHIGVSDWTLFVANNKEREGFAEVFAYVRNKIRRNQIEGAMVGLYRENLTARLNGIAENMAINELPPTQCLPHEIEDEEE